MTVNHALEGRYSDNEFTSSTNGRKGGRLSLMSFVALLANGVRSDIPNTASLVVRQFANAIDGQVPDAFRECLKPFAPRIVGTRDGFDTVRIGILASALLEEVVPHVERDFPERGSFVRCVNGKGKARMMAAHLEPWLAATAARPETLRKDELLRLARASASLICQCAREAIDQLAARWYWNEAIDLIDRMCDVREATIARQPGDIRFRVESAGNQPRADRI